ncbi:MAG: right-handed parallel beta-helix repeat-containing protein [Planctomycetota bacterium]
MTDLRPLRTPRQLLGFVLAATVSLWGVFALAQVAVEVEDDALGFTQDSARTHVVGEMSTVQVRVPEPVMSALDDGEAVRVMVTARGAGGAGDIIEDFVHDLEPPDWRVRPERLDELGTGTHTITAVVEQAGAVIASYSHTLSVRVPGLTEGEAANLLLWAEPAPLPEVVEPPAEPEAPPVEPFIAVELPTDESGWTDFPLHAEGRVIYVSSKSGSDNNSGYSPQTPLRTAPAGQQKLRVGRGDWLLLERGGRYQLDNRGMTGRSAEFPTLIGAYGDVAKPRPLLVDDNLDVNQSQHVALVDLDFYAESRDPYRPGFREDDAPKQVGLTIRDSKNIRVEGCRFRYLSRGIEVQRSEDVTFFRSVMFGNWSANRFGGHFQAQYSQRLTIEQCVFDHNGWLPGDGAKSGWAHTTYTVGIGDLTMKDNLFTRGSNVAMRATSGKEYEQVVRPRFLGNVVADHFTGLGMGKASYVKYKEWPANKQDRGIVDARVEDNVFTRIGARDKTGNMLDEGISLILIDDSVFRGNFFIHKPNGGRDPINWNKPIGDLVLKDNVVHQWSSKREELFQAWSGGSGGASLSGNSLYKPSGAYRDASRNLETYAKDKIGVSYDNMCRAMAEQRKGDWKPALTAPAVVEYIQEGYARD